MPKPTSARLPDISEPISLVTEDSQLQHHHEQPLAQQPQPHLQAHPSVLSIHLSQLSDFSDAPTAPTPPTATTPTVHRPPPRRNLPTTLLHVVATALATVLRVPDDRQASVYQHFLHTIVDNGSLSSHIQQPVLIALLSRLPALIPVDTITPWYSTSSPPTSPNDESHTPPSSLDFPDHLAIPVLLLPPHRVQNSTHIWRSAKRLRARRLLHAANRHVVSISHVDLPPREVMLSFSLTVIIALAALSRSQASISLRRHAKQSVLFSIRLQCLSFAVSFDDDAPCIVRFHPPGILASRLVPLYSTLVSDLVSHLDAVERAALLWDISVHSSTSPATTPTPT